MSPMHVVTIVAEQSFCALTASKMPPCAAEHVISTIRMPGSGYAQFSRWELLTCCPESGQHDAIVQYGKGLVGNYHGAPCYLWLENVGDDLNTADIGTHLAEWRKPMCVTMILSPRKPVAAAHDELAPACR